MSTNLNENVTALNTPVDYTEMVRVEACDRFPEVIKEPGMVISMRKHRHADCKTSNSDYIPDEDVFRKVMIWFLAPHQPMPLGLYGETGTGKTELLLYIADRLNEPVYIEKITTGMRGEQFEGGYELQVDEQGNVVTKKRFSQAAQAYDSAGIGGLCLLDEIDKANDDLSTTLHLFLEGKPWTLSSFSQTLHKHPLCRIAATANTTGEGGNERYITSNKLDAAVRNRLGWVKTDYPDVSRELEILEVKYPNLPFNLRMSMVNTALNLRKALYDPNTDVEGGINCPFSTRTLVLWGYYLMMYGLERTPYESLEFCFLGSVDKEDLPDVKAILQSVWDLEIQEPLSYFLTKEQNPPKK